jgi:hypothetical protein
VVTREFQKRVFGLHLDDFGIEMLPLRDSVGITPIFPRIEITEDIFDYEASRWHAARVLSKYRGGGVRANASELKISE